MQDFPLIRRFPEHARKAAAEIDYAPTTVWFGDDRAVVPRDRYGYCVLGALLAETPLPPQGPYGAPCPCGTDMGTDHAAPGPDIVSSHALAAGLISADERSALEEEAQTIAREFDNNEYGPRILRAVLGVE